jgi:steroid 5-alpha reductase family enzyme
MWKTVLFLIFTLIIVPVLAYWYDVPLTEKQLGILMPVIWLYLVFAGLCFIVSTVSDNYSQVDKLWSIMPAVYAWMICEKADYEPRLVLMAFLITFWACRLTFNFGRRGGYSWKFWTGEEDYRWAVLRAKPEFSAKWKWMLFNLFFISFYQMGLVMLITLPMIKAIDGTELGIFDYILAFLVIVVVILEFVADQQQWNYQKEKYRLKNAKLPLSAFYEKGFTHTGLWAYMRHPNYAAEQMVWILIYCFSIVATGVAVNWTIAGCLLLVILFKGSSDFSEKISETKYPAYKEYQKRVPRFVPFTKSGK